MSDLTINRFRSARGRILARQIASLAARMGRPIEILDVGGRADYWDNVGLANVSSVTLLNIEETELHRRDGGIFLPKVGDARDLSAFESQSVDLVHSNSVIEHVGPWRDMSAMASELVRVGRSGWVQTPAFEFPIEPHFRLPFMHWLGQPARRAMLSFSRDYRKASLGEKRFHVDRINLLSRAEVQALFPEAEIMIERFIVAKSYVARWHPT